MTMFLRRTQMSLAGGKKLTLSRKCSRLAGRLKDPEWRRYGALVFAGKLIGIAAVLFIMIGIPAFVNESPKMLATTAQAQAPESTPAATETAAADAAAAAPDPYTLVKPGDTINPINTTWTLLAAFLVFGMQ